MMKPTKTVTITCLICGTEFEALNYSRKTCLDCFLNRQKSIKPEAKPKNTKNPNQRLIDAVHEATIKGLSYGQYMGRKV